jgi:rhodanese-related sulfurtransferase
MKVIYHCYGGAHSSVTAAALHLGLLPAGVRSSGRDLEGLPYFDKNDPVDLGKVRVLGVDDHGALVLALARSSAGGVVVRLLAGLAQIYGSEDTITADTTSCVNWRMVAGGVGSRRLRWTGLGRPLVADGTVRALPALGKLVAEVKRFQAQVAAGTATTDPHRALCYTPAGEQVTNAETRTTGPRPRKVIYHCHGGTHSSVVAAALHLGMLPRDRTPDLADIRALRLFDRVRAGDVGTPRFCGVDAAGREVYALGTNGQKQLVTRVINTLVGTCYPQEPPPFLVDTLPLVTTGARLGGYTSRRLGYVGPGRALATAGIHRRYDAFVDLVHHTLAALGTYA